MTKSYFKVMLFIFSMAAVLGLALRILLKLTGIDPQTGFYTDGSFLKFSFGVITGVGIVFLTAINHLRKTDMDYPVRKENTFISLLAIVAGLSIAAFVLFGLPERLGMPNPNTSKQMEELIRNINIALGCAAGAAFVLEGLMGLFFRKAPFILLSIIAPAWQVALLLCRFNGYHSVLHISDHILIVGFMISATLFYLGRTRTVCGFARRDGRNYVISSGLCTSLIGALITIPNYIYMLVNKTAMPVASLSIAESIYILTLSVYSLFFVLSYIKSIRKV